MVKWLLGASIVILLTVVITTPPTVRVAVPNKCPPVVKVLPLPEGYTVMCIQFTVRGNSVDRRLDCATTTGKNFVTFRPMGKAI